MIEQMIRIPVSFPSAKENLEILFRDIEYNIDGLHFIIKAGFAWDGASIPPVIDRIVGHRFDPNNKLFSCVHDALFRCGIISRKETNKRCVELYKMRPDVSRFKRWLILKGLQAGSWIAWNKHRKRSKEWQGQCITVIKLPYQK